MPDRLRVGRSLNGPFARSLQIRDRLLIETTLREVMRQQFRSYLGRLRELLGFLPGWRPINIENERLGDGPEQGVADRVVADAGMAVDEAIGLEVKDAPRGEAIGAAWGQ
jgi:hypothetical protein